MSRSPPGPGRRAIPVALGLALLTAPGLSACDTALLTLIMERDRTSPFEAGMKRLSTVLQDVGRATRAGDRAGIDRSARQFLDGWQDLYERHYASPPRGHESNPRWRDLCDALTRASWQLSPGRRPKDLEGLHPVLRGLQDRLADFYLGRPGSAGPEREFELARARLAGLLEEARSAHAEPGRLREGLARLAARVESAAGSLAPGAPARKAWGGALDASRAAPDVKSVAGLSPLLEELRKATLARLWFSGGGP